MSRKCLSPLLAAMAMMAAQYDGRYRPAPKIQPPYGDIGFSNKVRIPADSRQLREFSIKGQKIMAYSRKDAIKRLKHKQ